MEPSTPELCGLDNTLTARKRQILYNYSQLDVLTIFFACQIIFKLPVGFDLHDKHQL